MPPSSPPICVIVRRACQAPFDTLWDKVARDKLRKELGNEAYYRINVEFDSCSDPLFWARDYLWLSYT